MKVFFLISTVLAAVVSLAASTAAASEAAQGAKVYFITPTNGSKVKSPVTVTFGLTGMGVAPAGTDKPNTGHHHLLIDVAELPDLKMPLPKDNKHRHFGGGQTEVALELSPGPHTLQLILGDMNHIPHQPPLMSEKIIIVVE